MRMLAALDLATGKIFYRIRDRKRHREFLDLLKTLRTRWTGEKLYVVCDNFSPHGHPAIRTWCTDHQVELVFLPTYGSWQNWIETEFAAQRYFALNGTNHHTHYEQNTAIENYVRWRNARAEPKTTFANDSPIRPGPITQPRLRDTPLPVCLPGHRRVDRDDRVGHRTARHRRRASCDMGELKDLQRFRVRRALATRVCILVRIGDLCPELACGIPTVNGAARLKLPPE
jgi:transposase